MTGVKISTVVMPLRSPRCLHYLSRTYMSLHFQNSLSSHVLRVLQKNTHVFSQMCPEQTATAAQKLHRCDYFTTVRHCACVGREEGYLFKDGQVVAEKLMCMFVCVVCVRACV